MAKTTHLVEVPIGELIPYEKNAKNHPEEQIEKLEKSIEAFGFLSPCLIDEAGNIIAGHGRVEAARRLGLEKVPCVYVEGLSEEERRAYILADNRLTELGGWNLDVVAEELAELDLGGFDIQLTGFEIPEETDWFENHESGKATEEDTEEYRDFLEKFEQKRTTDDCYTPPNIYEAIAEYVAKEYGLNRDDFLRPFYPGGDYEHEEYPAGCVVVDNPPFSILSEICRFYQDHGVRFFLFAPALTLFSTCAGSLNYIPANISITYENGAAVRTGFVTNLGEYKIDNAPGLKDAVEEQDRLNRLAMHKELPRYDYPDNVVTPSIMEKLAKYGQHLRIKDKGIQFIRGLDAQKDQGKAIYGGGFLLCDRLAEEKRAAEHAAAIRAAEERAKVEEVDTERWALSDRERAIVEQLNAEEEGGEA